MKKKNRGQWDMEPQKSSAAQYLTCHVRSLILFVRTS